MPRSRNAVRRPSGGRARLGLGLARPTAALLVAGCAGGGGPAPEAAPAGGQERRAAEAEPVAAAPDTLLRPVPNPIVPPPGYRRALERGTRSASGAPGPRYWQQWTEYRLEARLHPERRRLEGDARMVYHNRSPDTLDRLYLHLVQNVHAEGAVRNEPYEVTGGVELSRLAVGGRELSRDPPEGEPGWRIDGTILEVVPPSPVRPGTSAEIEAEWAFTVPRQGAGARMGRESDDLFFIAYWYPQMAMYDDVVGWHTDPFLGTAEFYTGFGSYELAVEAPEGWVVRGTGRLLNADEVLPAPVRERLSVAATSDSVVSILPRGDAGPGRATVDAEGDRLTWRFGADAARDAAFSATRGGRWDAVRAPVGDRDGDGETDHTLMEALWRPSAPLWSEVARYGRHALDFHSRYTGLPYPWSHMTAVEGGGIIGGGMEFPMMTLMGDYEARGDSALYFVTAHELAHMWVPMVVGTDEKRYSWMDEGMSSFLENQARREFFPGNPSDSLEASRYLELAREGGEGEMIRRSDFHYTGDAFGIASYAKPATVLVALRGLLGEETFRDAYRTFHAEWAFKHPKPWDFFATVERFAGRELDWFWRSWYYETWVLDQAVERVVTDEDGTRIVVADHGQVPMPVRLRITRADGDTLRREVPVETWLAGARRATVTVPPGPAVTRVEIDPEGHFPDVEPSNDVWTR